MKVMQQVDQLDAREYIVIKGAKMHNLRNVDVAIKRNSFTVITGLSGSGKSSLAFDTLYAEGQRRYIESLSAYARQFLGKIEKPKVDYIRGISPAVAIEQKVNTRNPRSTVGTTTEIYDYIKLLYARIGRTYSPVSGKEVRKHSVQDVINNIMGRKEGERILLTVAINFKDKKELEQRLQLLEQNGFTRVLVGDNVERLGKQTIDPKEAYHLVIDRIVVATEDEGFRNRLADSVELAFYEGHGNVALRAFDEPSSFVGFSNLFEMDGMLFEEPDVHFLSFNNPRGACKRCEGFGSIIGIDPDLVIPDRSLSVYQDGIVCWKGEKMSAWKEKFIQHAGSIDFPIHRSIEELTPKEEKLLWTGNKHFKGLHAFFEYLEEKSYKIQYRVMLSRYRGKTLCPECEGTRLRKDANYVKIADHSISELLLMPIDVLRDHFSGLKLNEYESKVAKRLLIEITNRLNYLCDVGLSYLNLNRLSNTLSGGESQRIQLATSLGSSLVGSMYILDEPSIGLHPRDTERLIGVLKNLQAVGNTLIVVEHDEDIMRASDELIDLGPEAGVNGGHLVFQGDMDALAKETECITARYLNGLDFIPVPETRRPWKYYVEVIGAKENNLKNVTVKVPLGVLTVVTGVSGSGKSSLIKKVLHPALSKRIGGHTSEQSGAFQALEGHINRVDAVEFVDQNPIGRSSRSNPVTFIKAFDDIRTLFANQPLAKMRGFKPAHFSFNVDGGRCEMCQGEGQTTVEMQFMPDIHLTCESCEGKRFKEEVLEVKYHEQSINDILELSVDEAIAFFEMHARTSPEKKVIHKLMPLQEVGLGYVTLGQSSSTLSGGEAQRIKLASFIGKGQSADSGGTFFLFDEPTTGLHVHDIRKLVASFNKMLELGHTILVIEHNLEVIKQADWLIDLGPEGGDRGGQVVFEGTPEQMAASTAGYTGKYLKGKL
ncbi:MAG: excinuclease ABC subunit UvrA [Flavobacteriales bacterium]|nr:excinuclease ABC subunit UvrA [Flavobacteriales bacterium]